MNNLKPFLYFRDASSAALVDQGFVLAEEQDLEFSFQWNLHDVLVKSDIYKPYIANVRVKEAFDELAERPCKSFHLFTIAKLPTVLQSSDELSVRKSAMDAEAENFITLSLESCVGDIHKKSMLEWVLKLTQAEIRMLSDNGEPEQVNLLDMYSERLHRELNQLSGSKTDDVNGANEAV